MSHKKDFIYNIGEEVNELVIVDKEYRVDKNNIKRKWYEYIRGEVFSKLLLTNVYK